jgi:hypothetical protein
MLIRRVYTGKDNRVGLYISPATRHRLNLYKAHLQMKAQRAVNVDEAITFLLDKEGVPDQATETAPEFA